MDGKSSQITIKKRKAAQKGRFSFFSFSHIFTMLVNTLFFRVIHQVFLKFVLM